MDTSAKGVITEIKDWALHPVKNDMDLVEVALTTMFVVLIAFLWTRVLNMITD